MLFWIWIPWICKGHFSLLAGLDFLGEESILWPVCTGWNYVPVQCELKLNLRNRRVTGCSSYKHSLACISHTRSHHNNLYLKDAFILRLSVFRAYSFSLYIKCLHSSHFCVFVFSASSFFTSNTVLLRQCYCLFWLQYVKCIQFAWVHFFLYFRPMSCPYSITFSIVL